MTLECRAQEQGINESDELDKEYKLLKEQEKKECMSKLDNYRKNNPTLISKPTEREDAVNLIVENKGKITTDSEIAKIKADILNKQKELQANREKLEAERKKLEAEIAASGCKDFFDKDPKFREDLQKYLRETDKGTSYAEEEALNRLFDAVVANKRSLSLLDKDVRGKQLSNISKLEKEWAEFQNKISKNKFKDFINSQL